MKIQIFIAGVLDPKWPLDLHENQLPVRSPDRLIMSPFDEAALEVALQIRDRDPAVTIHAVIAGGAESEKLGRAVAAHSIADVSCLPLLAPWDQGATARQLAAVASDATLILLGREFGDCDDGIVPAMLAALLGLPFFGRVQAVDAGPPPGLVRESGEFEERLSVAAPLVASATNDRRSRLRKPLMKNVMLSRQQKITPIEAQAPTTGLARMGRVRAVVSARQATACRMLDCPPEQQARMIAGLLREASA